MNRLKTNCLLDLSTIAGSQNSNSPWVNIQSAGWVNIQSAPTVWALEINF